MWWQLAVGGWLFLVLFGILIFAVGRRVDAVVLINTPESPVCACLRCQAIEPIEVDVAQDTPSAIDAKLRAFARQ